MFSIHCRWKQEGLPCDIYFMQNAIITIRTPKHAYCIDPENVAFDWLMRREASNEVRVLHNDEKDFEMHFGAALESGSPIIITSIGENFNSNQRRLFRFESKSKHLQHINEYVVLNHYHFQL